ncbi:MAG: hypothetical protein LBK97_00810 [Prevotellaceae bacterium]|jgi:trigger factor|nr:hypothetical protein [Prevotellaceae bacterium]
MELIQNKEGLVASLTLKISQEDYAAKVEKGLKKIRQTYQIKGFRPGNAPISLIKKMYGQPLMYEEITKLVNDSIENYEKENKGLIVGRPIPSANNQPLVESSGQKDFEFMYEAGFFPEFTYKIDKNTELVYYNILVEDEDIDEVIKSYQEAYPIFENLDAVGDDCLVKVNTVLVKEGEEQAHTASFITSVIPDEYKSLFSGAKVDDVINVEIRKVFTNELDLTGMLAISKEELELQPEILPFTIVEISKKTQSAFNQAFFDEVAGKDNIHNEEELREYLKKHIAANYEIMSFNQLYADAVDVLKEKANIVLPDDFIKNYIEFMKDKDKNMREEQSEYLVKYFTDGIRWNYILGSLLEQANIEITYDMIKLEVRNIVISNFSNYQHLDADVDIDDLTNYYLGQQEYVNEVYENIKIKKLTELLKENAKLNVIDVTIDEFKTLCKTKTDEKDSLPENNSETYETVKDEPVKDESETENAEVEITETQEDDKEKQE